MVNSSITLTASMRSNLMSLKTIATQMDRTQNILSTGKKVNSAIDNASSYYQARSLTNRAGDLNSLLDAMGQGIQTIQAATEGLESASAYLEQMKSVAEQALTIQEPEEAEAPAGPQLVTKDLSWYVDNGYTVLTKDNINTDSGKAFRGNDKFVLAEDVEYLEQYISEYEANIIIDGNGHTMSFYDGCGNSAGGVIMSNVTMINMKIEFIVPDYYEANGVTQAETIQVFDGCNLTLSNVEIVNTMAEGSGIRVRNGATLNIDETVKINAKTDIVNHDGTVNGTPFVDTPSDEPNPIYKDSLAQYSSIMTQFDELVEDTSYQGVNLLTGGNLTVTFNESRSHELTVKGKDMRTEKIGLSTKNWQDKKDIEDALEELTTAMGKIRSFSAELGNNYAIIQTRQDFTDALVDVLQTGADNLVLADMNEASAQYLMLQTRQQLATNSLSLASQSAQSILSLF